MKKIKKFIIISFLSIFSFANLNIANAESLETQSQDVKMARLFFAGDVLPHINFDNYARNYGSGEYNYDRPFEKLKDYVAKSDYFMVNCEFTTHPDLEPSGYPTFNSNEDIFRALSDIGVDVITTANNHCMDTGLDGLDYTIEAINKAGIENVGTQKNSTDKNYLIKDINGIKVGILAYAEQLNGFEYLLDSADKLAKVNMIDSVLIRRDISNAIRDGAEFIIIYPHWGVEYQSYPEEYQIELAHDMIDWGADMVIGNHPHVIQPREEYEAKDGRKGIIYYSLGNLVSNQNHNNFDGDYRVEHGLLVDTIIYKGENDTKAKILNTTYHTTWVGTIFDDYGLLNRAYVIDEYLYGQKDDISEDDRYLMGIAESMNYDTMHTIVR